MCIACPDSMCVIYPHYLRKLHSTVNLVTKPTHCQCRLWTIWKLRLKQLSYEQSSNSLHEPWSSTRALAPLLLIWLHSVLWSVGVTKNISARTPVYSNKFIIYIDILIRTYRLSNFWRSETGYIVIKIIGKPFLLHYTDMSALWLVSTDRKKNCSIAYYCYYWLGYIFELVTAVVKNFTITFEGTG